MFINMHRTITRFAEIYAAYYYLLVHIMSHGVVAIWNDCQVRAGLIHRSGIQVSQKKTCFFSAINL